MRTLRKGFTLIELLTVISIIAILAAIVMSSTSGAYKYSNRSKMEAIFRSVELGFATYYAQKDRWPGSVDSAIENNAHGGNNNEGIEGRNDYDIYVLSASEVRDGIQEIIKESIDGNPLMDISGLYVSRHPGEANSRAYGYDFMEAVRRKHWRVGEMYFGYPHPDTGYFRRLNITYKNGTMEVGQ